MSDLKQTIKKSPIFLMSVFAAFFLWKLINEHDLYIAAKSALEVFIIASLCVTVAEAAHWYQTKRFI